jgi:hypothetical protein
MHVLVPGLRTGSAVERSGVEIQFTARARPLGRQTPWYAGFGVTFLELDATGTVADEQQYFLLLAGASWPRGLIRPFVEVQALDPFRFSSVTFQVFAGAVVRVY